MTVIGRLSRTTIAVESLLADTFAQHGLDASSFDVLATLLRSGTPYQIVPAELARESMISTSAVAQRLNKLEALGLVARGKPERRARHARCTHRHCQEAHREGIAGPPRNRMSYPVAA